MAKKNDITNKTIAELDKLATDLRAQIEKTGLEMRLRKIKDSNAVKKMKLQLARVLTIRRYQELATK